jgi:hypothetical protein
MCNVRYMVAPTLVHASTAAGGPSSAACLRQQALTYDILNDLLMLLLVLPLSTQQQWCCTTCSSCACSICCTQRQHLAVLYRSCGECALHGNYCSKFHACRKGSCKHLVHLTSNTINASPL